MQYSIVNLSEARTNNVLFRWDSEYWHPSFIENSKLIFGDYTIRDFVKKNIGNIKSSPLNKEFEYLEISKIPLNSFNYQTKNVDFGEEPDRAHHILQEKDVVISTVRPNRNAIAFIDRNGIVGSSGLSVLRANNIEPEYLFVFCKTNYFVKCLMRSNKASMYPAVSHDDVLNTPLFIPSDNFKSSIISLFREANHQNKIARETYNHASTFLFTELGLNNWQPKHQLTFVKNHSDIKQAERIDANYFQPKYDEIVNVVKNYSGGWDTLGNLCELVGHPTNPPYETDEVADPVFIISQKHLGDYALSDEYWNRDDAKYTTSDFADSEKQYILQSGDLVMYTVGGPPHIGKTNLVFDTVVKSTIGSFVTLIRAHKEKIDPCVLLSLFNSQIGYQLTNRFQRGMVQQYIYPKDLVNTVIPIPPREIQTKIQQKITKSFALREQSKRLLETAKRAVEIAIEQDEQTAINWLESESAM